jgi:hypothetical protein
VSGNSFKDLVSFAREPYRQELERLALNLECRHERLALLSFVILLQRI